MAYRLHFKILIWLILIFLPLINCGDIPRDNILDPKNSDSYRLQNILVEAFVNTTNDYLYNQYMLDALDSIASLYRDRIILMEYHRTVQQWDDPYHLNSNNILYDHYLDALGSDLKGVPDVFINGINHRIQGASSFSGAFQRIQEAVIQEVSKNSYFTIEASFSIEENNLIPKITLARLGNSDIHDILIKGILISEIDRVYLENVVRASTTSSIIPVLKHGEYKSYTLPAVPIYQESNVRFIVYITNEEETAVYQSRVFVLN